MWKCYLTTKVSWGPNTFLRVFFHLLVPRSFLLLLNFVHWSLTLPLGFRKRRKRKKKSKIFINNSRNNQNRNIENWKKKNGRSKKCREKVHLDTKGKKKIAHQEQIREKKWGGREGDRNKMILVISQGLNNEKAQ